MRLQKAAHKAAFLFLKFSRVAEWPYAFADTWQVHPCNSSATSLSLTVCECIGPFRL